MGTKKIPVCIITGFLGSGKTTLLQYILGSKEHGKRIAVIENEFGSQLGVHNEVSSHALDNAACVAEIFETSNGCLCCGGGGDFIRLLYKLIEKKNSIDYVIIETTGLADPTFTQHFFIQDDLKEHYFLDGIVTLVDALNARRHLSRKPVMTEDNMETINEAVDQIAVADRILINKIDLINDKEYQELEAEIKSINSYANIYKTKYSVVDLNNILDIKSFDIDRILAKDPGFLDMRPYRQHDQSVTGMTLTGFGELDLESFQTWFQVYLNSRSSTVYRSKGVLNIKNSPNRYILQGVHSNFTIQEHLPWNKEPRSIKLVLIGKDLRPEAAELIKIFREKFATGVSVEFATGEPSGPPPSPIRYLSLVVMLIVLIYPQEMKDFFMTPSGVAIMAVLIPIFVYYRYISAKIKKE